MNFPQLKIEQQFARISLEIKKPDLKVEQGKAHLQMKKKMADLIIRADNVEINVDNYPSNYDLGYKNTMDLGREIAGKGREVYLQYVKRSSNNGDRLMRIEGNTSISDIAVEENFSEEKELNLKWKRGPEIDVKKAKLEIDYKPGKMVFSSQLGQTNVDLNWGKVNISLRQYPYIDIQVIGGELNIKG